MVEVEGRGHTRGIVATSAHVSTLPRSGNGDTLFILSLYGCKFLWLSVDTILGCCGDIMNDSVCL